MIDVSKIDLTPLYDGAAELVRMYRQELELQRVNASGELSRSLDFDVDFDENDIALYFIYNSYGYYINEGRRPTGGGGGQPWGGWRQASREIQQWIENKISRGWWIPRNNKPIPRAGSKEIKGIAYTIVRKIHNKGFYGQNHTGLHILEKVLRDAEASGLINKMIDNIVQAYDNQVNIEIEKI